jgi:hypothetical protein
MNSTVSSFWKRLAYVSYQAVSSVRRKALTISGRENVNCRALCGLEIDLLARLTCTSCLHILHAELARLRTRDYERTLAGYLDV